MMWLRIIIIIFLHNNLILHDLKSTRKVLYTYANNCFSVPVQKSQGCGYNRCCNYSQKIENRRKTGPKNSQFFPNQNFKMSSIF